MDPALPPPSSRRRLAARAAAITFWVFNAAMAALLFNALRSVRWQDLDPAASGDGFEGSVAVVFSLGMFLAIWVIGAVVLGALARRLRRSV